MTDSDDTPVSLARLEGKVDTLAAEVRAGDKQSGQLVELLKQQLIYLQQSIDDLKSVVAGERAHTDRATSAVRIDLERQLNEHRATVAENFAEVTRRFDQARDDSLAMFTRVDDLETYRSQQRGVLLALGVLAGVIGPVATGLVVKAIGG